METAVAVVTGATRGIGAAIAEKMSAKGFRLMLAGRDEEGLTATRSRLREAGNVEVATVAADLTTDAGVASTVAGTVSAFGRVDVLVNNAGRTAVIPFPETSRSQLRDILATNVETVFMLCQAVAEQMIRQGDGGKIISVGTVNAMVGVNQTAAYSASKGAVAALTRTLAVELAPHRIQCNLLAPGTVLTDRVKGMLSEADVQRRVARIPSGRLAEPDDVADAAVFLASGDARFVNGQEIVVDGGFSVLGA